MIVLKMEALSTSDTLVNFYRDHRAQHPRRHSSSYTSLCETEISPKANGNEFGGRVLRRSEARNTHKIVEGRLRSRSKNNIKMDIR
jgi:hypothetical protein